MNAQQIYDGSDGAATKAFYAELLQKAPGGLGNIAVNLFRAHKCSARAKVYRGGIRGKGSFRGMAYDRKRWSMEELCKTLTASAAALSISWGWKEDPDEAYASWVLYVDLPQGQASFHSPSRMAGPDYKGDWDGLHLSGERIIAFCDSILNGSVGIQERETAFVPPAKATKAWRRRPCAKHASTHFQLECLDCMRMPVEEINLAGEQIESQPAVRQHSAIQESLFGA